MAFARALPSDRRESVEESLAARMESFSEKYDFTPEQMAELDRRVAEKRPEFAAEEDISNPRFIIDNKSHKNISRT